MALRMDGDLAGHILSCLDARHLARMECTHKLFTESEVMNQCWGELARHQRQWVVQNPWLLKALPPCKRGKEAFREALEMNRWFDAVPESWSAVISMSGASRLQVLPQRTPGSSASAENTPVHLPEMATVPLSLGTVSGKSLVFGWRVETKTNADINGVWFGLEFSGLRNSLGRCMSICYSPSAGECIVKMAEETSALVAGGMTPLAGDASTSYDIYVTMSEARDVEFVQISEASNCVVRSGVIPSSMVPSWTKEVYPSITIEAAKVSAEMHISSVHRVPPHLQGTLKQSDSLFDGMWCVRE